LFVYGTLRPCVDIPMARWLRDVATHGGSARTHGRLYDLGPYPGLRPARRCDEWVTGDLYRVSTKVLRALDRYEAGNGSGAPRFVRQRCVVRVAQFRSRSAWVYVYQQIAAPQARVRSGDYRLALRSRSQFRGEQLLLAGEPIQ